MIADDDNIVQHMLLKNFTANYTIFEINEWTHLLPTILFQLQIHMYKCMYNKLNHTCRNLSNRTKFIIESICF